MPIGRPASAPLDRSASDRLHAGERLLRLQDLIKDEHVHEIPSWYAALPIVGRARARWIFEEPAGALDYPRQRARREILDVPSLDDLDIADDDDGVERHNKTQWIAPLKGPNLEAWKGFCLATTNQRFQKVPEPDPYFGPGVWIRMFRKSHGGIVRKGALELVEAWQPASTKRQREALSELLWSFQDHLTARRGKTTTCFAYGPKQGEQAHINLIDPFSSSLGRPSSAPIAHAVHRKFERAKRAEEARVLAVGQAQIAKLKAAPRDANTRREIDTLKSNIPFNQGQIGPLESSNQAQMRTVKPKDTLLAIEWGRPFMASCPPASAGMGRMLGKPEWHGDAMYTRFWPSASKGYLSAKQMQRPHEAAGNQLLVERSRSYLNRKKS